MIGKILKLSVSFVILLHCIGVTQYAGAYTKNSSAFVSMLTMTEEENKKESESKEDVDDTKEARVRPLQFSPVNIALQVGMGYAYAHGILMQQYTVDQPTPPPDYLA